VTGLIFFGVVLAYLVAVYVIFARAKHWVVRTSIVLVALAIPIWDLPIGYIKFNELCSEQSGVRLEAAFLPTDSILIAGNSGYGPEKTLKIGFKTVEYLSEGKVLRFTRSGDELNKTVHDVPNSLLQFQFNGVKPLPWNLSKSEFVIARVRDGQVVARKVDFGWRGMWWESTLGLNVTPGLRCTGVAELDLLGKLVASK
jgi:hypothetical protein